VSASPEWIAVDWGTSNLRAWGIGADGSVVFSHGSDQGMARLRREQFAGVLEAMLAADLGDTAGQIDVLISGMAGARQGWLEAPYLDAPADLGGLAYGAVRPEIPGSRLRARILPGVCQKTAGAEDVMRGEETQLLGLSLLVPGFAGTVVMPGTHCKWVALDRTRLVRFATAMSGEIYDTLGTHSVLRHSLQGDTNGPEHEPGLEAGLAAGFESPEKLTSLLFKVRAASLLSGRGPDWCAGFLSGLLIGTEIAGHRDWLGDDIVLIGSPALCALYARGLGLAGIGSRTIDATEAALAGLKAARART
jgi:2-dehydro-3-deoxygalactonokinase